MLFVIESAIIGYVLFWLDQYGLDSLWKRGVLTDTLAPWVIRLVYISIAAALETLFFICLSLLYREKTAGQDEVLPAPVG
jgi:hypothetical protein